MESKNSAMATTTEEREGEELELGLSLGGSYNKRRNDSLSKSDSTRSSVSPSLDPKMKREIHALRRQEAKRKREEKQLKQGYKNTSLINGQNIYSNNGMWLKAKALQRDVDMEERECKKSKTGGAGSDHIHTNSVNLNLGIDQNDTSHSTGTYSTGLVGPVFPGDGFVYRCANMNVVPCSFTAGEERNVVQGPVFGYGFVPFQAESDPERNSGRERGNRKAVSNGSLVCTSSTGSDHRSSSHEGDCCLSCPSRLDQPQLNVSKAHDANGHSELSATSELTESVSAEKMIQSMPTEPKEEAKMQTEPDLTDKHISLPENATPLVESKVANLGKPPKPQSQNHSTSSLPYMPCVSTTGNGPNGKTINGFLYRYTKREVSIICVCHGSSFSPAEFVQHAGGADVSRPLRHITVIPPAF